MGHINKFDSINQQIKPQVNADRTAINYVILNTQQQIVSSDLKAPLVISSLFVPGKKVDTLSLISTQGNTYVSVLTPERNSIFWLFKMWQ